MARSPASFAGTQKDMAKRVNHRNTRGHLSLLLILALAMSIPADASPASQAESSKPPNKAENPNPEPAARPNQPETPPLAYNVSLQADTSAETGKPVNFSAQLFPELPTGKPARYCFSWGDGTPTDCQDAPAAVHIYRARGRYSASVEVLVDKEKLASTIQIDAALPLWMKGLFMLSVISVLGTAILGARKTRDMIRSAVSVNTAAGRHRISPAAIENGEPLHIRCVRTAAVSKITFTSSKPLPQDNKETASV